MIKSPMLAVAADEAHLRALPWPKPYLISAKLDGVRALCMRDKEGKPVLVSRKFLPIPNLHTQRLFAREELVGLDGELCVGPTNAKNLMQATTSGCMSVDGEPDVTWQVFDKFDIDETYVRRAYHARNNVLIRPNHAISSKVLWLSQYNINSYAELAAREEAFVEQGYEGAMLRDPLAPYKQGRSTLRQGMLLKIKRFADSEAEVLDTYEQMRNENEATTDNLGYTKRSTHAAGKVASGVLGGLRVRDIGTGVEFDLGGGFTAEQRRNLWEGRRHLIGKLVTYKHFPVGVVDKPRFPVFKAFRDRRDT